MTSRKSLTATSLLLASTALMTMAAFPFAAQAAPKDGPTVTAQAAPPAESDKDKKPQPPAHPQNRPEERRAPPPAAQQPPAAQPHAQTPPAAPQPRAVEERRPAPQAPTAQQERREEPRGPQREERRAPQPSQAQPAQPPQQPAPSTAQQPQRPNAPATAQERREERRDTQREERRPQAPSTAQPQQPPAQQPAPSTAQQPQPRTAPSTAQQPPQPSAPSTAQQPQQRTAPSTAQQPAQPSVPATAQQPQQTAPAATTASPAAVAPPTQARNANEFIRRDGAGAPARSIDTVRQERQEVRDGNRTIIREQDRTIIREGNTTIIRHNEAGRFAIDARSVRTERRGANTETIIERGNGVQIVTVTDADGRLLRRVRRDGGREVVIIDNSFAPRTQTVFVQLPPPVIRIPRQRYILEAERARPEEIYEVFMEPPVERIEQRYTLEQVRYSAPLRDRMPRVDLDITFDTGSWQLSPEQVARLAAIADGIKRAVERNPREVFMVEGHTDAVGADVDNLSLSDRRAEAVAVALTEQFQVPAENLVTQGYGEQYLKVQTDAAERANRRVAVRRITPLIDQQAANTGGR